MKFRLSELILPLSQFTDTTRAGNARQGCTALPEKGLDTDSGDTASLDSDAAIDLAGQGFSQLQASGGFEPKRRHAAPRVSSKKKRFG